MSVFVNKDAALKIAEEFLLKQLGHAPKIIGVNKSGSKKQKDLMQWVVVYENSISGNVVDGPGCIEVSARTGEITWGIREIT